MNNLNELLTLWLDLDGVIADFEAKVSEINDDKSFEQINKGRIWRSIKHYDANVEPFFESLPMMADARQLLDFATNNFVNIRILTATGYVPKNAAEQKRAWVKKHISPSIIVKTVTSSADKAKFAGPNQILVDDRTKSTIPWQNAGGIAVLHTRAADTIKQLQEIIKR